MEQNVGITSGVTKAAALREGRYQRVWMEAGVRGEISANVPGPVVLESPLPRDIVIIQDRLMEESIASGSGRSTDFVTHSRALQAA